MDGHILLTPSKVRSGQVRGDELVESESQPTLLFPHLKSQESLSLIKSWIFDFEFELKGRFRASVSLSSLFLSSRTTTASATAQGEFLFLGDLDSDFSRPL